MNLICTAEMGPGTFEAKFMPLSMSSAIDRIYVLRSKVGPRIPKVRYIVHPWIFKFKLIKIIFLPLYLAFTTIRTNSKLILSYHFIPHAIYAYIASYIANKPFIYGQTGLFIQKYAKQKRWKRFVLIILNKAKYVNVPGNQSLSFWNELGVSRSKINILHSTIDTSVFSKGQKKVEYDFLILSRLAEVKKIDVLISYFSVLKEKGFSFSVLIVGDGPCMSNLKNLVDDFELSELVHFVGFQKNPEEWFAKSRFYLMNSSSEGLPTSLMQAMSCELVSLSNDVGNISDMVLNGINGFLVDSSNTSSYEEKLLDFLNMDSETYRKIGREARETIIKHHSYSSAVSKWNQILS